MVVNIRACTSSSKARSVSSRTRCLYFLGVFNTSELSVLGGRFYSCLIGYYKCNKFFRLLRLVEASEKCTTIVFTAVSSISVGKRTGASSEFLAMHTAASVHAAQSRAQYGYLCVQAVLMCVCVCVVLSSFSFFCVSYAVLLQSY